MVFKMRSNSGGKYGLDFRLKKKRDCFPKNNQNRTGHLHHLLHEDLL